MDDTVHTPSCDQDKIDTLIAISVVAKQMARKLEKRRDQDTVSNPDQFQNHEEEIIHE